MVFIDSNVIFDLWDKDPLWAPWSQTQILKLGVMNDLVINPIVYAEVSPRFNSRAALDRTLETYPLILLSLPREAAFQAGQAHVKYREAGGTRTSTLPDFFIGAHALVLNCPLLTRDTRRYATYFPTVRLITP